MFIFEAFTAYLKSQTALTAIIDNKIFPDSAPEKTVNTNGEVVDVKIPYIVYKNIGDVKKHVYGGMSSLQKPSYQLTIYAEDQLQAETIGDIVIAAFYRKEKLISGVAVKHMKLINELSSEYVSSDGTLRANTKYLEYEVKYIKNY